MSHKTWTSQGAPASLPRVPLPQGTGLASGVSFQAPGSRELPEDPQTLGWGSLTKAGMHHSPGLSDAMGSHQTLPAVHHQIQSWSCHRPGETPRGNSPSRQDKADARLSSRNPHPHPKSHSAFLLAQYHCFRIPGRGGGGGVDFSSIKPGSCFCSESFLQGTRMPTRCMLSLNPTQSALHSPSLGREAALQCLSHLGTQGLAELAAQTLWAGRDREAPQNPPG